MACVNFPHSTCRFWECFKTIVKVYMAFAWPRFLFKVDADAVTRDSQVKNSVLIDKMIYSDRYIYRCCICTSIFFVWFEIALKKTVCTPVRSVTCSALVTGRVSFWYIEVAVILIYRAPSCTGPAMSSKMYSFQDNW